MPRAPDSNLDDPPTRSAATLTLGQACGFVALIAVLLAVPGCFLRLFQLLADTTVYAPGFRQDRFDSIRVGMDEAEVRRLLGAPLSREEDPESTIWTYAPEGYAILPSGAVNDPRLPRTVFAANSELIINYAAGHYVDNDPRSFLGRPLSELRERFGPPRVREHRSKSTRLSYSASDSDGSYHQREIILNGQGRVESKIAAWYQD